MTQEEIKNLEKDADGMKTYEFLVNNIESLTDEQLTDVIDNLAQKDHSGQYLASGVKYMNAINANKYRSHIQKMTSMTIDRDREHHFLGDLIQNLYGEDYYNRVEQYKDDDNFRRMYKRLYPTGVI